MENSILEFKKVLDLKSDLILRNEDELLNKYFGKDKIRDFLQSVKVLVDKETGFLQLTPRFIEEIEDIIQFNFSFFKDKEIIALKNEIIVKLNLEKFRSDVVKTSLALNYVEYQDSIRRLSFADMKQFLGAMSYDAVILEDLLKGDLDSFEFDDLFLATTNYFLEMIPEIYQDENIRNITLNRFDKIDKKTLFKNRGLKKYMKTTKEVFQMKA